MGKCLSRWCNDDSGEDVACEPVRNGHTVVESQIIQKDPVEGAVAGSVHKLQPTAAGTPNTPRSVHVTMFVCQNGTRSFNSGSGDASSNDGRTSEVSDGCNELFDAYCDPAEDCILAEGVERLCTDLGVQPEDFVILVLAWHFKVSAMCRFTRKEFVDGCRQLGVDSVPELSRKLPVLASNVVTDYSTFRVVYQWSYRFALDQAAGQRTLPVDVAVAMWRVVFSVPTDSPGVARSFQWVVPMWLEFLEQHSGVRGITRDTWDMFLNFVESLGEGSDGLSGYDETEAWPSLFDDFVKWAHIRQRSVPTAWPEVGENPATSCESG